MTPPTAGDSSTRTMPCFWPARTVQVSQIFSSGNDVAVQVPSFNGYTYQLQITASLTPTNWVDSSPSQGGTGGVLTFTDSGGGTNNPSRFYRIHVTEP